MSKKPARKPQKRVSRSARKPAERKAGSRKPAKKPIRKKAPARKRASKGTVAPRSLKRIQSWLFSLGIFGGPLLVILLIWRILLPNPLAPKSTGSRALSPQEPRVSEILPAPAQAEAPLAQDFARAEKLATTGDRVAYWVEQFLDGKFSPRKLTRALASVAKPEIHDSAPLIPRRFDCTTFVETASALARSHSAQDFYGNLLAIRYDHAQPDFQDRNHFPVADWIPHNIQAGILHDITAKVGEAAGVAIKTQSKVIDKAKWFLSLRRKGRIDRAIASGPAPGWDQPIRVSVPYLPVSKVAEFASRIPNGTIVNLVRSDRRNHPVIITHQGFVIQKDGSTFLRHSTVDGRLKSVLLRDYLARLAAQGTRWPLLGINLNQLNEAH